MRFGEVDDHDDLTLPGGDEKFGRVPTQKLPVAVGLGMWNKSKVKRFFPRGTRDELAYYSTQFNSVELNATFHKIFPASQIKEWRERTPPHFTFVPKVPQEISHFKRLRDFEKTSDRFVG